MHFCSKFHKYNLYNVSVPQPLSLLTSEMLKIINSMRNYLDLHRHCKRNRALDYLEQLGNNILQKNIYIFLPPQKKSYFCLLLDFQSKECNILVALMEVERKISDIGNIGEVFIFFFTYILTQIPFNTKENRSHQFYVKRISLYTYFFVVVFS